MGSGTESTARRGLPGLSYPEEYLARLALDLSERFDGVFNPETVERYVLESYAALLRSSIVRAHLPIRTVKFATDRLTALATAKGALPKAAPTVLFVCEQNAGRSQMAAALVSHLSRGRVQARSAGSAPAGGLLPTVVEALAELGIDVAEEFPKPLTDDVVQAADAVVTMGCGDACPVYPGKRYQDWKLEDPAGKPLEAVRAIRDEIVRKVEQLLATL